MEKIAAAIIGLGRIASLLEDDSLREKPCTHAGAIRANSDCVLAGGCDTDESRRKLFAERWGVPVYADAAEMIRAQNPKILVIATHPDSHYHYCRMAAVLGVPVVICEKPLATTLSLARKIACLSTCGGKAAPGPLSAPDGGKRGITVITNHERRYSADYRQAKEILAEKKLGAVLSVRAALYMGKNKRLLDVLWHDGTHLADALMFLTGALLRHKRRWGAKLNSTFGTAWLEGELARPKFTEAPVNEKEPNAARKTAAAEETCARRNQGRDHDEPASIPVIMEIGAGRDHLVFEIEFSCAKGRLRIGNGVFEVWESGASPYAEKFRSLKQTVPAFEGPTGYFANMLADAVSCARGPGKTPASSADDGLAVIKYLHSVKIWR